MSLLSNLPNRNFVEGVCCLPASDVSASTPQVRRNRHIEILPLSTGCLGACTYCKTKHARGQLGSYDLDALVQRSQHAAADPQVHPWCCTHAMLSELVHTGCQMQSVTGLNTCCEVWRG
jgi:hypothetical protein